jgi:Domain of unknown function (DUF1707)/Cell wall-active antibiotics response 4TMS YvqF
MEGRYRFEDMAEPVDLRASDTERHAAVERLRDGAAAGRLTLEELSDRIELAQGARTRGELEAVVADLPDHSPAPSRPARRWIVGILSGAEAGGRWRLGEDTRAVAVLGSADVDLREAELSSAEPTLTAVSVLGEIEITVPEGVDVELRSFSLLGGIEARKPPPAPPGAPRIVIRAFTLLGSVELRPPTEPRRRRRGPLPPLPPPPRLR